MTPLAEWGNVWGTSVTVPVTMSTSYMYSYLNMKGPKTKYTSSVTRTLNVSKASIKRTWISLRSHWFHRLSLSTSSRLDGTSKSPREHKQKNSMKHQNHLGNKDKLSQWNIKITKETKTNELNGTN